MSHTLVVVRHAKSDWGVPVADRDRPLGGRGRRQAPRSGEWIADEVGQLDLAVVSTAARARQTWALIAEEMEGSVPVEMSETAYTFDGAELLGLVRSLPETAGTVALVSHNPAVEELVGLLTGESVTMPTSALAVVELDSWSGAGGASGRLTYAGRPADD